MTKLAPKIYAAENKENIKTLFSCLGDNHFVFSENMMILVVDMKITQL